MSNIVRYLGSCALAACALLSCGCGNDAGVGPVSGVRSAVPPPAPVVLPQDLETMRGYWPLVKEGQWVFSHRMWFFDGGGVKVFSGKYTGTLIWDVLSTKRESDRIVVTVRQRFTGTAREQRMTGREYPYDPTEAVDYSITDDTSTFDLIIHADSSVSVEHAPSTNWGGGWTLGMVRSFVRVPPADRNAEIVTYSNYSGGVTLRRAVGPTVIWYEHLNSNTYRTEMTDSLTGYTFPSGE